MLFQALDDKKECLGVYLDGKLIHDVLPEGLTQTWSYSAFLRDTDVEYAKLYCGGLTLDQVCPSSLRTQWEGVRDKLRAYFRSFNFAKVSLDENCFFDLVPQSFLLEFCDIKNVITESVFETLPLSCRLLCEYSNHNCYRAPKFTNCHN